ncbi:hypothetical protein Pcinc_005270 [Petrolisthes cinctipes]|uniref:Uncharacterized protein n=1 Tax=Petrolisthes cinctipes TaxID=88211 RepID=A0AAE1KZ95_PETCI|nr:hypothetical protein Pcinc_005270 [Petrolisthes cinctipes]
MFVAGRDGWLTTDHLRTTLPRLLDFVAPAWRCSGHRRAHPQVAHQGHVAGTHQAWLLGGHDITLAVPPPSVLTFPQGLVSGRCFKRVGSGLLEWMGCGFREDTHKKGMERLWVWGGHMGQDTQRRYVKAGVGMRRLCESRSGHEAVTRWVWAEVECKECIGGYDIHKEGMGEYEQP